MLDFCSVMLDCSSERAVAPFALLYPTLFAYINLFLTQTYILILGAIRCNLQSKIQFFAYSLDLIQLLLFGSCRWFIRSPSIIFISIFCKFLVKYFNDLLFQMLDVLLRCSLELLWLVWSCPAALFRLILQHCTPWVC